jgi:hypothetical protein
LIDLSVVLLIPLAGIPLALAERPPVSSKNVTAVGRLDIDGGGIVQVHGNYAYVGHMEAGARGGTSIVDVSDPKNPKLVSRIFCPPGVHSHKVRVDDESQIMMVNYEKSGSP